jgi:hypothetical protein
LHPKAFFRGQPITIEDVLNSPVICDPLRLLEIVMPCWGGTAFVVTSRERAQRTQGRPVNIIGGGSTSLTAPSRTRDFTHSPVKVAADRAIWPESNERDRHGPDLTAANHGAAHPRRRGFCDKATWCSFQHDLTWCSTSMNLTGANETSVNQEAGAPHLVEAVPRCGSGRARQGRVRHRLSNSSGIMSEQIARAPQRLKGPAMPRYRATAAPLPSDTVCNRSGMPPAITGSSSALRKRYSFYARSHCPVCLSR